MYAKLYHGKQECWKESERSFGLCQTIPCEARTPRKSQKGVLDYTKPYCVKQERLVRIGKELRRMANYTMGSKNAVKSRKGALDYAKPYCMKQEPLERVRKELLITPSCAKQSNNTPKGSFGLHRGEKLQNRLLQSENNTHNHDFL